MKSKVLLVFLALCSILLISDSNPAQEGGGTIITSGKGMLVIESVPAGARVYIDDIPDPVGKTPFSREMTVGKYKIRLLLEGYLEYSEEVTIGINKTTKMKITLNGIPGKLIINSVPQGASVFIGGEAVGKTPVTLDAVNPGKYVITISLAEYQDYAEEIQVENGKTKEINAVLTLTPKTPPDMVLVPAGEFIMGEDGGDARPVHRVYLDAFYIDKYEVTVQQYGACVQLGRCLKPDEGGDCNWGQSDRGNHPINCVDWNKSKAYCESVGKRLPTEAEWEKAARGTDGRKYPWGSQEPTCDLAVFVSGNDIGCGRNSTWPVGSKPAGASPYGAMDMAGNVWNWVADWWDPNYYQSSPNRNPTGPPSGQYPVLRGGAWDTDPGSLRSSARSFGNPVTEHDDLGFRCARTR